MKKRLLFIAATHGNEEFSVPVLERLSSKFDRAEFSYDWIIGNPLAYEKGERFIETDMNRAAPGNVNGEKYEERRAAEILNIAKNYELVVDIHGSLSDCGVTTLIPNPSDQNIELAKLFNLQNNIIWVSSDKKRTTGPLVQFMEQPAIELECGPKQSPEVARELERVLEAFITNNSSASKAQSNFYEVYGKVYADKQRSKTPMFVDFEKTVYNNETFYPYLAKNTYKDILCYKMKKL